VSVSHPILSRLDTGRPLLVSGDALASLGARGVELHGPAALGRLLREHPSAVREHYHQEISAGVDVLCCLTADTIPRALQQIGMPFRSAALTGDAVELALDVAELTPRPLIVAGVLGNTEVPPVAEDRVGEELGTHAARLAAAGCELILARGFSAQTTSREGDAAFARLARQAAVVSGVMTQLPTWAVVALDWGGFTADGARADECARHAFADGAQVILFEIPSTEVALGWVDRLLGVCAASSLASADGADTRHLGFALAAGSLDPDAWAHETRRLIEAGVRVVGGGAGTTQRHLAALAGLLRGSDRQSLWPAAPAPSRAALPMGETPKPPRAV
jgi:methionine synthase I (cobalamin-dependent)